MTERLHDKFRVERTDLAAQDRHKDCWVFVLEPAHDPIARIALKAYADAAVLAGQLDLAVDLRLQGKAERLAALMMNDEYRDQRDRARELGLAARHETRVERAIRRQVAEELRQLGAWRGEYCHSCPQNAADYHALDPMALSVHEEHATAAWLADIIEGKNDAMGWLPSWRWDDWTKLRAAGSKVAP